MEPSFLEVQKPVDLSAWQVEPPFFDKVYASNVVQVDFSILHGVYLGKPTPIACDSAGKLSVADAASLAMLISIHADVDTVETKLTAIDSRFTVGSITGNHLLDMYSRLIAIESVLGTMNGMLATITGIASAAFDSGGNAIFVNEIP